MTSLLENVITFHIKHQEINFKGGIGQELLEISFPSHKRILASIMDNKYHCIFYKNLLISNVLARYSEFQIVAGTVGTVCTFLFSEPEFPIVSSSPSTLEEPAWVSEEQKEYNAIKVRTFS